MEKIFLAIGNRDMEEYLKKALQAEVRFVGETVYREGVKKGVKQFAPNLVLIKESLKGSSDMLRLIYDLRTEFPEVRIIYVGPEKSPADNFYATLVNYGVYDLIVGGKVRVADIITRIRFPAKHADVKHFQPAPPKSSPMPESAPIPTLLEEEGEEEGEKTFAVAPEPEEVPVSEPKESLFSKLKKPKALPPEEEEPIKEESPEEKRDLLKKKRFALRREGVPSRELSKEKIVTFLGGRSGVGTTTLAVNTAFALALKGFKVLYMEVNRMHPSATYWFDVGREEVGIDVALKALEEKKMEKVFDSIIRTRDLKKGGGAMKANYKKFPDSLDFMSYSGKSLLRMEEEALPELKELYLYLLYQGKYDFVIVDLSFFSSKRDLQSALLYSNRVFTVLNQDISTVGYHLAFKKRLEEEGVDFAEKNHYIINSFAYSKFGEKDLRDWLNVKRLAVVPSSTAELSESNSQGLPAILFKKRSDFSQSIKELSQIIGGN